MLAAVAAQQKKPGRRNMSNDRASSVIGYCLPFTLGHCGLQHHIYMTRNSWELSGGRAATKPQ